MKTIAISIDDDTLGKLDELVASSSRVRNRSAAIRQAIREFAEREMCRAGEERDRAALRKHRTRLASDARALVRAQARR